MFKLLDFVYENCLFKQFKVNDLLFVEYKCVADESKLKVWSQHNYFIYVMSGKKTWQTIRAKYVMTKDQAIFVKKGANIVHQFFDLGFCCLIIFVPDHFIVDVLRCNGEEGSPATCTVQSDSVIPIHLDPVLTTYIHSVFAYFLKEEEPPKHLLEIKFKELILDLVASKNNSELCSYFQSLCFARKNSMSEVMEANFIYNMKLEDFARLTDRSLTSFKRDFVRTYKTTPGKWLSRKKLEYARFLLKTTDKNINELTFETGFENPSHFIRSFREAFKMTPLQFRKSVVQDA